MDRAEIESEIEARTKFGPSAGLALADPLSETTRKRQMWLLGVAVACVVLSRKIMTITQISENGLTLSASAQPAILLSLKWICAYLAMAFGASTYRDMRRAYFTNLSNRANIARWQLTLHVGGLPLLDQKDLLEKRIEEIGHLMKPGSGLTSEQLFELANERSVKYRQLHAVDEFVKRAVFQTTTSRGIDRSVYRLGLAVEVGFPLAFGSYAIFFS